MKKETKIYLSLTIVVVVVILGIYWAKGNGNSDEKVIQCIAENSQLIIKEGCPACASQENLLKENIDKFNVTDCSVESKKCIDLGITHVPTWIINGEKYEGVQSIEKLKELTGC